MSFYLKPIGWKGQRDIATKKMRGTVRKEKGRNECCGRVCWFATRHYFGFLSEDFWDGVKEKMEKNPFDSSCGYPLFPIALIFLFIFLKILCLSLLSIYVLNYKFNFSMRLVTRIHYTGTTSS